MSKIEIMKFALVVVSEVHEDSMTRLRFTSSTESLFVSDTGRKSCNDGSPAVLAWINNQSTSMGKSCMEERSGFFRSASPVVLTATCTADQRSGPSLILEERIANQASSHTKVESIVRNREWTLSSLLQRYGMFGFE